LTRNTRPFHQADFHRPLRAFGEPSRRRRRLERNVVVASEVVERAKRHRAEWHIRLESRLRHGIHRAVAARRARRRLRRVLPDLDEFPAASRRAQRRLDVFADVGALAPPGARVEDDEDRAGGPHEAPKLKPNRGNRACVV
jgi:hypothetical protein